MAQGFSIISEHPKYIIPDNVDRLECEFGVRYCGEVTEQTYENMGERSHIYSYSTHYAGYEFSDGSIVIPFGDSNSLFVSAEASDVTPATETELESLLGL